MAPVRVVQAVLVATGCFFLSEAAWASGDRDFDLHAALGLAGGGDNLITAQYTDGGTSSVDAGAGISLSAGVTWMPLWLGETFGLGLGLDAGWKYKSLYVNSDGSASLRRFPLTASVQSLLGLNQAWHLVAGVGVDYETGIRFRGDGLLQAVNADFDDAVGGFAELGVLWRPNDVGFDLRARYTGIHYTVAGERFNASNVSALLGIHYFP